MALNTDNRGLLVNSEPLEIVYRDQENYVRAEGVKLQIDDTSQLLHTTLS